MARFAVCEQLRADGRVIELEDGKLITAAHRAMERAVVRTAQELAEQTATPMAPGVVKSELGIAEAAIARGGAAGLAPEQAAALRAACGERR